MYAVVQTGGKQYRVCEGDTICVEKLAVEAGDVVTLDTVLAVEKDGELLVGKPFVEGAAVTADVIENGKGKKVVIYKYKAKKDYHKKQGHRQPYTKLQIKSIAVGEVKKAVVKEEAPAAEGKVNLKSMKKAELIAFAEENKIEMDAKLTNAEMIAVIEAAMK